ncbi:MAG: hypothetical protein R3D78_12230 [Paracoccaceae bacterium]
MLPLVGGNTRFQPVWVEDVAQAAEKAVLGQASGTYELGGPDVATFKDLMAEMLQIYQHPASDPEPALRDRFGDRRRA